MNDEERVKKLVEWAHNRVPMLSCHTCQYTQECTHYGEADEGICNRALGVAKAILSYPGLALRIDTTRQRADEDGAMQTYKAVEYVPLAPAIKEIEDGHEGS